MDFKSEVKKCNDNECVIIFGSYTNAITLVKSLQKIAYNYPIYIIDPSVENSKCFAEIACKNIRVVKRVIDNDNDLFSIINCIATTECKKNILFTNEQCMNGIEKGIKTGEIKNVHLNIGSKIDNDLIFNRLKFYKFIEDIGIDNVPKTIDSDKNPFDCFGEEFLIRQKRSWKEYRQMPRNSIVRGYDEFKEKLDNFRSLGITDDKWCYQELLSISDKDNVSVCGWYSDSYKQFVVTRKVIQHPPKVGGGDVVESVLNYDEILVELTETVLERLNYSGPFEMEFVYDNKKEQYKFIELNPRFWMQNGLVDELTNYSLIKSAVGQKELESISPRKIKHFYWVNGTHVLYRIFKGNLSLIRYLLKGKMFPSFLNIVKWSFYRKKYINEVKKRNLKTRTDI